MAPMLTTLVVAAAAGFMFGNSAATSMRADPLAGSGELMQGALRAPGAVQVSSDPSLPDAAQALRALGSQAPAADAPTF
ncbi:MAG TPA: hypothetical protein VF169_13085 [Albitalea sp.]|uniref:hypothetical protein n=1 Tax=Piscinibacter sp. TaxID=1903157 RepID=UPI002ED354A3